MLHKIVLITLITFTSSIGFALEVRFGPEFAFSSQEMINAQKTQGAPPNIYLARENGQNNVIIQKKKSELIERWGALAMSNPNQYQLHAKSFDHEHRFLLTVNNDFYLWAGVDPAIIEMGTSPMTVEEFRMHAPIMEQLLFEDMKKHHSLEPQMFTGGGHINISFVDFAKNPLLLANFLIDFYNHPELAMGVFGYDTGNAISLRQLLPNMYKLRTDLEALLKEKKTNIRPIFNALRKILSYNRYDKFLDFWDRVRKSESFLRSGNVAIAMRAHSNDLSDARIEIRAVRPQKSMDMWLRQIELLQARINYLEQFDELLPIIDKPIAINKSGPTEGLVYDPPVDPQEALQNFYKYVTESGQKWEDHQDYIWPRWISSGELEKFNKSIKSRCTDALRYSTQ